ncbi:MAG: drug/metabolite transporter (DMT)-like permease [Saprospiraceae bacterium]|jgi:drug/metabolite transporter (DMT)-like permease
MANNKYYVGVALVLLGGSFLSLSGILLRHVESADGWQILFYRSIVYFITILVVLVSQYRGETLSRFKAIGREGLLAGVVLGAGSVFYIMAMLNTTVANVVFILGATPLIAALAGWLFLKEKVSKASLVAMLFAIFGIGIMLADGFVSGGMLGNFLALILVFMFVAYLLILRNNQGTDMLPATCLSGLVTAGIAWTMLSGYDISQRDLTICLLLGSVQFGLGFIMVTWGTQYIPAAEVALFAMTETLLNPVWVWLGVGEVPSQLGLIGSAVVLVAVIGYTYISIQRERSTRLRS